MLHFRKTIVGALMAVVIAAVPLAQTQAASQPMTRAEIREAQSIMVKFNLPTGPVDGYQGPKTLRGLCAFRYVVGASQLKIDRSPLDRPTLDLLRDWNNRYANLNYAPRQVLSNGVKTYVVVDQTCQILVYVRDGVFAAVFPASTGRVTKDTPNGYYRLGDVTRGWTCSKEYPENCRNQSGGRFASLSGRGSGNMYNKRPINGGGITGRGFYVHGSNNVPTSPGSAGCVRVSVEHADWIYDHVPTDVPLLIQGKYTGSVRTSNTSLK